MADVLEMRPAPPAVRALSRVMRWLPIGRYRLIYESRRFPTAPFVAHLSPRLGALAFHCDPRDSVAREVCYTGLYEPQETQLASRLVRAGDVFVDVGANWGYFALAAAHWVGPSGRVLAFEPEPRLFDLLSANLRINGLAWVEAHRRAVAAERGTLRFSAFVTGSDNWGRSHSVASGAAADFESDAVALDDVLDDAGIDRVQLTKIDVEGGEIDVLTGMRRGLQSGRYRYLLVECHPDLLAQRGHDEAAALRPLVEAGYRLWAIVHTPHVHRLAARKLLPAAALLRPYVPGSFQGDWPHLLAAAPGAAEPS
jgi:FkbM family methyltransferase